jgi:hypothetical protein
MRCPFRAKLDDGVSDLASMPSYKSRPDVSARLRWSQRPTAFPVPDPNRVSATMPCRGIAYQPRVPTLGLHPEKQIRVLKERRILFVSGPRREVKCGEGR